MSKTSDIEAAWNTDPFFNRAEFALAHDVDIRYVYRCLRKLKEDNGYALPKEEDRESECKESIKREFKEYSGYVEINSLSINTLDAALDESDTDLSKWQVEKHLINSWQVTNKLGVTYTNWQVKVWLKPYIPNSIDMAIDSIIKRMPLSPKVAAPKFTKPSATIAEIALIDVHMGKLAWGIEVGGKDYDLQISTKAYLNAVDKNLGYIAVFKPELVYFVLGQDLMHIENIEALTPMGKNRLDYDSRLPKIYEAAMETTIKAITRCRSLAPVEVLLIPGNHDMHASMYLAYAMQAHFRSDKYITVDASPENRKARAHGNLLVGWAHDASSKQGVWANELAQRFPKLWGASKFREWHTGHKHKKSDTKMKPTDTHGGVLIRQLSALSEIDKWHYEHGFTDAVPGSESFVWSKDNGIIANFTVLTN